MSCAGEVEPQKERRAGTLARLCAFYIVFAWLLAGCISQAAPAAPTPAPPSPVAAAPTPSPIPPTPSPAPPTPDPNAPPRVGIQVGHWKIEDHPDEQARLRKFSGAYYRGYDEWEINIVIAEELQKLLEAAGVEVDLLPATVPVGYEADAFISIHVDGVTGAQAATRRGWKLATPFRASPASEALAAAISASYPVVTGLPDDPLGPSYDMRAYYAFAHYRYWHSIAPTTPAVIVECGFMTHPADRELLFDNPSLLAQGIAQGVLAYLKQRDPTDTAALLPVGDGLQRPAFEGVPLRARAREGADSLRELGPADRLVPMAEAEGWVLVFTYGDGWELGWVRSAELEPTDEPLIPPTPRP